MSAHIRLQPEQIAFLNTLGLAAQRGRPGSQGAERTVSALVRLSLDRLALMVNAQELEFPDDEIAAVASLRPRPLDPQDLRILPALCLNLAEYAHDRDQEAALHRLAKRSETWTPADRVVAAIRIDRFVAQSVQRND